MSKGDGCGHIKQIMHEFVILGDNITTGIYMFAGSRSSDYCLLQLLVTRACLILLRERTITGDSCVTSHDHTLLRVIVNQVGFWPA